MRTRTILLAGLALGLAVGLLGTRRWNRTTAAWAVRLTPRAGEVPVVEASELDSLPAPVARYLGHVLPAGHGRVRGVRLTQEGTFLLTPPEGWQPFTATQWIGVQPAGFVWDARIRVAPFLHARVRDGFAGGTGSMRAQLLGLVPLVGIEGTPEIAKAALERYLAEAPWCPTALLPEAGVRWEPMDDSTARARLEVDGITAAVEFHFGADGLVSGILVPDRGRAVGSTLVPTAWEGRWGDYTWREGMLVPSEGEVAWLLPEGRQPYWRGRLTGYATGDP